jgi:hypothetical protein
MLNGRMIMNVEFWEGHGNLWPVILSPGSCLEELRRITNILLGRQPEQRIEKGAFQIQIVSTIPHLRCLVKAV